MIEQSQGGEKKGYHEVEGKDMIISIITLGSRGEGGIRVDVDSHCLCTLVRILSCFSLTYTVSPVLELLNKAWKLAEKVGACQSPMESPEH